MITHNLGRQKIEDRSQEFRQEFAGGRTEEGLKINAMRGKEDIADNRNRRAMRGKGEIADKIYRYRDSNR